MINAKKTNTANLILLFSFSYTTSNFIQKSHNINELHHRIYNTNPNYCEIYNRVEIIRNMKASDHIYVRNGTHHKFLNISNMPRVTVRILPTCNHINFHEIEIVPKEHNSKALLQLGKQDTEMAFSSQVK